MSKILIASVELGCSDEVIATPTLTIIDVYLDVDIDR